MENLILSSTARSCFLSRNQCLSLEIWSDILFACFRPTNVPFVVPSALERNKVYSPVESFRSHVGLTKLGSGRSHSRKVSKPVPCHILTLRSPFELFQCGRCREDSSSLGWEWDVLLRSAAKPSIEVRKRRSHLINVLT